MEQGRTERARRALPLVYEELRRLAARYMKGDRIGQTLQATALVNEAYLQAHRSTTRAMAEPRPLFAMAARLMRPIRVDAVRARGYQRRGGGATLLSLEEALVVSNEPDEDLVAPDAAHIALAMADFRKSQVVEMRFFGGLTLGVIAEALHVSRDTVKGDGRMAKLWLLRELRGDSADAV